MMIGAIARIGMLWLATIHGIRLRRSALTCTIATASAIPSSTPMTKPASVAEIVTQAWVSRLRGLSTSPSADSRNSRVPMVEA